MCGYFGHLEVARILLDEGADKYAKDNNGFTPLDFAVQQKKEEMAAML